MKTKFNIFTLLCIFTITLNAQSTIKGSGNVVTKSRTVSQFNQLSVSGHFNVTLNKGNGTSIEIKAEDNLIEHITSEVEDGKLKIKFEKNYRYRTNKSIDIVVNFESLNGISLSGSGEIIGNDTVKAEDLKIALSGSGDIKLDLSAQDVVTSISGSGDIKLSGNTNTFTASISGSGDFDCESLTSNIATVKVSGSGDIKIRAEKEIHAKTSGSGDIYYYGHPSVVKAKSSGSGDIEKRG